MYRRRYYNNAGEDVAKLITVFVLIIGIGGYYYFKSHPEIFLKVIIYISILFFGIIAFYIYIKRVKKNHKTLILSYFNDENDNFKSLQNFVISFGKQKEYDWKYREYSFKNTNLIDIRNVLIKNGVPLSSQHLEDICLAIENVIDARERKYLQNVVESKEVKSFSKFGKNGKDFENLISRLSDAMGYSSKVIGSSGDQGGDVIAARDGERVLIQAKFYTGSVGNAAVQQATAAMKYHNCTKALVVTTSYYTPEAKSLAQSNNVKLVDGNELKKLLADNLHEAWTD